MLLERVHRAHEANDHNLKKTLHQFCIQGDVEAVQSLFEQYPDLDIDICSSKGKNTPLHSALIHNQQGFIIDYLIAKGANVDAFNTKGYNCAIFAIANCHGALALEKLIRAGAVWKHRYGRGTFAGLTLHDVAHKHQNSDAVELLQRLVQQNNNNNEKNEESSGPELNGILRKKPTQCKMCSICKSFVKFPSKLSFIEYGQELAEAKLEEEGRSPKTKEEKIDPANLKKELYTSRKYLDQFLSHPSGAYEKLLQVEHHGINNKNKLRKEISESYSILHAVQDCLGGLVNNNSSSSLLQIENTFIIDLCAGKSLTTALCGALFPPEVCSQNEFLAVDRLPDHLIPHFLPDSNTSYLSRDIMLDPFFHELAQEVDRQTRQNKTAVLVGMHLCGKLSERAIELFERIPSIQALVLCPCCLPKSQKKSTSPTVFDSYWMQNGGEAYITWCSYLEEKIQNVVVDPDERFLLDVRSYRDSDIHSSRNSVITVTRK